MLFFFDKRLKLCLDTSGMRRNRIKLMNETKWNKDTISLFEHFDDEIEKTSFI